MTPSKFIIGSAQFGLDYGISNEQGKVKEIEINKILAVARKNNIFTIDTAKAYGNAEQVLGKLAKNNTLKFITKISPPKQDEKIKDYILRSKLEIKESLRLLNIEYFDAVLIHDASVLKSKIRDPLINFLKKLKSDNITKKIGISLYEPEEVLLFKDLSPDLVQVPLNLFDQRFLVSGVIDSLHSKGIEVHARSVFLQGLLLMKPKSLPTNLSELYKPLEEMLYFFNEKKVSVLSEAISFVYNQKSVDQVILGVTDHKELIDCLNFNESTLEKDYERFAIDDYKLIDPRRW